MAKGASWGDTLREVVQAAVDLVRAEVSALSADIADQGRQAARAGLLLLVAGALAFWAVGLLLTSVVLGLLVWLEPWLAALLPGALLMLIAGVLGWLARKRVLRLQAPGRLAAQRIGDHTAWWEREFGQPSKAGALAGQDRSAGKDAGRTFEEPAEEERR